MGNFLIIGRWHDPFASTDFGDTVPGGIEERYGPFLTYVDARKAWVRLSGWTKANNSLMRYFIVEWGEGSLGLHAGS